MKFLTQGTKKENNYIMKKYEFTGKKLDATIEEALKTLNKKQEEVNKIIDNYINYLSLYY